MKNRSTKRDRALRSRRMRRDRIAPSSDGLHAKANSGLELRSTGEPLSLCGSEGDPLPSFNAVAYTGGIMTPKLAIAWNGPVVVDLAGMESVETNPIHRDHDESKPIGHSITVDNDGTRLVCAGVFSVDSPDSREIVDSARKGFPWRPSVGVRILSYTTLQAGQSANINGRVFDGPLLWVKRSQLKEISLVTIPGDESASITILASQNAPMNFDDYCAGLGIDPATASPELIQALKTAFAEMVESAAESTPGMDAGDGSHTEKPVAAPVAASAPQPDPESEQKMTASARRLEISDSGDPIAVFRERMAAETERANQVRDLCAKFGDPTVMVDGRNVNLAAHAIKSGWSIDQTELTARRHQDLEAARDSRPRGPAIHSHSRIDSQSIEALQAGLLLRAGCQLDSEGFANPRIRNKLPQWLRAGINDPVRQRVMDNGHSLSDVSLLDACKMGLQARGVDVPSNRVDMLQAAFSSGTAAALFGATIGAKMLESYAEVDDFSQGWCSEDENPDLEFHNRNRTQAAQSLAFHPPGGEAPHAGRTVVTERAQVNRWSRQMVIDEADLLADNFGKFKDTPRDFGMAAGRVRPDLVATVLLSNPNLQQTGRALFNATDGNTATAAALNRANLSALIAAIRKRRDGDASLDLPVTHLLVPPDLLDAAIQLCYSVVISNDSGSGEMNPIKQYGITPVSEPRLANGLTHPITGAALAGSLTQYYGVSSKARTIEVTYLQGAGRVPVVRSETLTGGQFGLVIDVRHYVGATPLDWRGFHRQSS